MAMTTGLVGLILLASGAMADITPAVRADLAPTGKLRAAINYGNFILATKDKTTGESKGAKDGKKSEGASGSGDSSSSGDKPASGDTGSTTASSSSGAASTAPSTGSSKPETPKT